MISLALYLTPRQSQLFTPRLQQAVRLLQISTQDFHQELRQMSSTNPFLDLADEWRETPSEEVEGETSSSEDRLMPAQNEGAGAGFTECKHWHSCARASSRAPADRLALVRTEMSLREHLHHQLRLLRLTERELLIGALVVEALDEDGYLRIDLADLPPMLELTPPVEMSEIQFALKLVQSLDPSGVGCRDTRECLRVQLQGLPDSETRCLALSIVQNEFKRLVRHDIAGLAQRLSCSPAQIERGCDLIRRLAPYPGRRFGAHTVSYLVPDVLARKIDGCWQARLNPAVIPRIGMNQAYVDMFSRHRQAHHADMAAYLQEARWIVHHIEQRFRTIQRVAQAIVTRQQRFFEHGALAMLPLGLKDIADGLGLHESTISRATSNKFMATPTGIFELKYFFSRALHTLHDHLCSTTAIRGVIQRMIHDEDSNQPLSDVAITRLLSQQGLKVARRTVTKYRQSMRIPPMDIRRRIA